MAESSIDAFASTVAGLLAAIPAVLFHNYLHTRVDSLKIPTEASLQTCGHARFAETLPLLPRLSQISFAVIAVPLLSDIYSPRRVRILYLVAEDGVEFQRVADLLDTAVRVRPNKLKITVQLVTPRALSDPCLGPAVISSGQRASR